jgi:osmotically-inducible protein OsmY
VRRHRLPSFWSGMMRKLMILAVMLLLPALGGCAAAIVGGAAAGAAMATDRRTAGIYTEDENIEWKISLAIRQKLGDKVHVNVTSYNRIVLLTGEAPDEQLRQEIEKIARGVQNVRELRNEIAIGTPTSVGTWSQDSYITTKVKYAMLGNPDFSANNIKVVTENGVVYLMGLVTCKEAAAAAEVASTTSDVTKVVKVFEYTD